MPESTTVCETESVQSAVTDNFSDSEDGGNVTSTSEKQKKKVTTADVVSENENSVDSESDVQTIEQSSLTDSAADSTSRVDTSEFDSKISALANLLRMQAVNMR